MPSISRRRQRRGQPLQRLGAIGAGGDHLHQQRDRSAASPPARLDPAVAAGTPLARQRHARSARPVLGWKSRAGILGVDPHLDGRAARRRAPGRAASQLAGGLADHPLHQVDAGHLLGDAVLDLQAGVHLQEEELLGAGVDHELDRAGRGVARRPGPCAPPPRCSACRTSGRSPGRGRLLDHLLVAPLGASSRARPAPAPRPAPSPKICTSTCRAASR